MNDAHLLVATIFLPLVGALIVGAVARAGRHVVR